MLNCSMNKTANRNIGIFFTLILFAWKSRKPLILVAIFCVKNCLKMLYSYVKFKI